MCSVVDARDSIDIDEELFELLILAEDRRFLQHRGFDKRAIMRAIVTTLTRKAFSGARTLEMQFVRTVTDRREITLRRKILEILIARCLSSKRTKRDIAAAYMDIAYFGEGVVGAEAASRLLFRRDIRSCTLLQKAVIVAALKRPIPKDRSNKWYERVFTRSRHLLKSFES